jgi:anti-anti-sigma regulatory factor
MSTTTSPPEEMYIVEPAGITELVRGTEQRLIALFAPVVQRQSIALDFCRIERIDAAGIAALITLYNDALHAGHAFAVCNVNTHVAEILSLVGLASILIAKDATPAHACSARCACTAA